MRNTNWTCLGSALVATLLAGCGTLRTASDAEPQDASPWQQIQQNTAASFVIIDYYPRKSDPTRLDSRDGFDTDQRRVMELILNENTTSAVGVIINDTGEIFTTER
jgi:hypothetical protein